MKLAKPGSSNAELVFFVRGGTPTKVKVPLGNFELKYANGKDWYSSQCLFGINTTTSKADELFRFEAKGNQISGFTVELIRQRHGNLETHEISRNQW